MDFKTKAKELVSKMTLEEKMNQISFVAHRIDRLNLPDYNYWSECLHGLARCGTATVFPQAIGMAASFDDVLLEKVADAVSDEARAKYNEYRKLDGKTSDKNVGPDNGNIYRCLTMFTPNINIFRDPRWGRGHETYGEDPYLTGRMGSAFVRGLQGYGEYHKVDATIKHYAVHSGPEKLRHCFNADISDEDLYGTYLKAFDYCIRNAGPASVMSAYNAVHGVSCTASRELLVDILRGRLGFEGYVVSDYGAVSDIYAGHKNTDSRPGAVAAALNNGCDLCLGDEFKNHIEEAYRQGLVDEKTITEACERVIEARYRLGLQAQTEYDKLSYDEVVDCQKHRNLNLKMARESIVLLKNNGILPLKKDMKVAVVGALADNRSVLSGNYNGYASRYKTFLDGIYDKAEGRVYYEKGCSAYPGETDCSEDALPCDARIAAAGADVVIVFVGLTPRLEGEEMLSAWNGSDGGDKVTLDIPKCQQELADAMLAQDKPVIYVNVSGSALDLRRAEEKSAAVIQCFYPGALGGQALAEILYGEISPSGKLPVTFYRQLSDVPPFEDYNMKGRTYRFFEGTPLYPFGYGLSYAKFRYSDAKYTDDGVSVKVKNVGTVKADETVELYTEDGLVELAGFTRVTLEPNEEVTVTVKPEYECRKAFIGNGQPKYTPDGMGCHVERQ